MEHPVNIGCSKDFQSLNDSMKNLDERVEKIEIKLDTKVATGVVLGMISILLILFGYIYSLSESKVSASTYEKDKASIELKQKTIEDKIVTQHEETIREIKNLEILIKSK